MYEWSVKASKLYTGTKITHIYEKLVHFILQTTIKYEGQSRMY